MSDLGARLALRLGGLLALQAVVFGALAAAQGAAPGVPTWLSLLALAALGAAGVPLLLRPLAGDFVRLRAYAADPHAEARPVATAAEMNALFEAVEALRERSAELEAFEHAARRATEDAERMRVTFVASMGHDLRGPLNSILGFADLLAMEGVDEVAESQKQSVSIIRRSARDLLVLLDQILDWAWLQAGRIELSPEPVELPPLLQEVAREAEQRSADRGLSVRVTNLGPVASVAADPKRLRQALLGLMDHATRVANAPHVSVVVRCEEPWVEMDVHDPVLEIRESDQQSFFEAFRPSYRPGGERIAGLGLGPALARALIRAHGGDVWFDSQREQGTTFHLRLPLAGD